MSETERTEVKSMVPFFVIWTGQAFSLMGSRLVQFALVWWLTQETGSAKILAFATMMALLPQIVLSPVAGALVDRWNRRRVMLMADSLIASATALLALLYALDAVQVWHVYVLMFVRSTGGAFHWPAMQASTTLMVPQKHLSRVAGLNQTLFGVANIVSPPLGALLLEWLPLQGVLGIDVGTALLAITPLFFIPIPQPRSQADPGVGILPLQRSVLSDLGEGLRFVWGRSGMMLVLLIATLLNMLITPAFSLLPIMVTDHFGGDAFYLAQLNSAWGIGMVLGGIVLSLWGGFKRRIVTAMSAMALMGIGFVVVGLTPASLFALAMGALFFSGFMNPIVNGSFMAVLQSTVPPEMQGRVFTLVMSGSSAMSPLGLAIAGPVADLLSVQVWFLVGGVTTLLLGAGGFAVPAIMQIEDRADEGLGPTGPDQRPIPDSNVAVEPAQPD